MPRSACLWFALLVLAPSACWGQAEVPAQSAWFEADGAFVEAGGVPPGLPVGDQSPVSPGEGTLEPWPQPCPTARPESCPTTAATHGIVYDKGWTLRPYDPQRTPYELTVSFQNQFRYTGAANEEPFVPRPNGLTLATPDRNSFDINRGRLIFSGYAFDPRCEFYLNIDYNTVTDQSIQALLAWMSYRFSERFSLAYGLGKLPGTWEWQEPIRFTQGIDRSMATTFFRPSITAGIWAYGELHPGLQYRTMLGNGFNTLTLDASEVDTNLTWSGLLWWEPMGDFGAGFSDFERHAQPALRLGHAFTHSKQDATAAGDPGPEQAGIRLSNGVSLASTGALAAGLTVNSFDLSLYAVHAGWKHQGRSLSGEYFFRWLTDLAGDAPVPVSTVYDHGFFVQAGAFLGSRPLEVFGRGSAVFGPFGEGSELGAGVNWFPVASQSCRITLEVTRLDDCPTQQDRTGYVAGATGCLVRLQAWTCF